MDYVMISQDDLDLEIKGGPWRWDGFPPGHGTWTTPDQGFTWVNDTDPETQFAGTRWHPPGGIRLVHLADASTCGYTWPPPPPQLPDADADGSPDDYDADPADPTVQ